MTYQLRDRIVMQDGKEYDLLTYSEGGLFNPKSFRFPEVFMSSTACWRGYWCLFESVNDTIHLKELHIRLEDVINGVIGVHGPTLNSIAPVYSLEKPFFDNFYYNLNLELNITVTGVEIGGDPQENFYQGGGSKYKNIYTFDLLNGKIVNLCLFFEENVFSLQK